MARLKVGVCELHPEMEPGSEAWNHFARHVRDAKPDVFLINEMPFGSWISAGAEFDPKVWQQACQAHERGVSSLGELGSGVVLGSRATELEGRRVNEAFVWTEAIGHQGAHTKQFFPNEAGYYEARWFQPGDRHFRVVQAGPIQVGFLVCTEVMFNEHARHYGRNGAQLIAVPRATPRGTRRRWLVAMQMAAIVSGCYVLSSNRNGVDSRGQKYGGYGWVVDPNGDMVSQTSSHSPVVYYEIDTELVAKAQRDYPCNVKE
jgi:N-carbamoylputrescine amidase